MTNDKRITMFLDRHYPDRASLRFPAFSEYDDIADPFRTETSHGRFGGDSGVVMYTFGDDNSESEDDVSDRKSKVKSFSTTEDNADLLDQWAEQDGVKISDIIHDALKAYAEKRGDTWQERNANPAGDASYLDEWRKSQTP